MHLRLHVLMRMGRELKSLELVCAHVCKSLTWNTILVDIEVYVLFCITVFADLFRIPIVFRAGIDGCVWSMRLRGICLVTSFFCMLFLFLSSLSAPQEMDSKNIYIVV